MSPLRVGKRRERERGRKWLHGRFPRACRHCRKCALKPSHSQPAPAPPADETPGLEVGKQYRFRVRPLFASEGTLEWGWSPASPPASPAVLNSLLATLPAELVGAGAGAPAVPRESLAGKIVGEKQ